MTRRKVVRGEAPRRTRITDLQRTLMRIVENAPVKIDRDPAEAERLKADLKKNRATLSKRRA